MTDFPTNPFEPGFGVDPAHRGPRPEVESALSDILSRTRSGARGSRAVFLYGPRGNGKTVLLHWLHAEAMVANISTVVLVPEHLESPVGLREAVRIATQRFPKLGEWLSTVEADFGRVNIGFAGHDSMPLLANLLSQGKDGLLLTLDEAHEAPPEMLGRLLNAAQLAGENRSIAVVFAGTPGLETGMRTTHASFWSRGRKLRIGLLDDDNAREALARPFQNAGIETDDEAVAELASAADNYPYFLQLYGEAAWTVVEGSGGRVFLPEHVAPALAAANGAGQSYYRDRYEEFLKAGLLPLARLVAEAFVASADARADRHLTEAALRRLLECESCYDHRTFFDRERVCLAGRVGNPVMDAGHSEHDGVYDRENSGPVRHGDGSFR